MSDIIITNGKRGASYSSLAILPEAEMMAVMYNDGFKLIVDGKKLSKAEAVEIAKNNATEKQA